LGLLMGADASTMVFANGLRELCELSSRPLRLKASDAKIAKEKSRSKKAKKDVRFAE